MLALAAHERLFALRVNGRLTINDPAEKVGLLASPCWTRVGRMEANGTIQGYAAVISRSAVGLHDVVFGENKLEKHGEKVPERFGHALGRVPQFPQVDLSSRRS